MPDLYGPRFKECSLRIFWDLTTSKRNSCLQLASIDLQLGLLVESKRLNTYLRFCTC